MAANPVIAVRVPQEVKDELDRRAKASGVSVTGLVAPVIIEAFGPGRVPSTVQRATGSGLFGGRRLTN